MCLDGGDRPSSQPLHQTPTGRLTTPDEVAAMVRFLASDSAAQIIGQVLAMDGGKGLPG